MSTQTFARFLPSITSLILCACSSAIVKPSTAPVCEIPATLASSCELPAEIGTSLTYGQLIALDISTREKLSICSNKFEKLKASYQSCTEMLTRYNAGINEADQALRQKRTPADEVKKSP